METNENIGYDIIDEIKVPEGMKARLIQVSGGKIIAMQTWGAMRQTWITTCRYRVMEEWARNKTMAESVASGKYKYKGNA